MREAAASPCRGGSRCAWDEAAVMEEAAWAEMAVVEGMVKAAVLLRPIVYRSRRKPAWCERVAPLYVSSRLCARLLPC
jgi:hypothetical protein